MKCDSGQDGCQPCTSKNFRCVATDRITGHAYERGETARLKKEVEELRAQVNCYYHRFGPLPPEYSIPAAYEVYPSPNSYHRRYVKPSGCRTPFNVPVLSTCLIRNLDPGEQLPLKDQQSAPISANLVDADGPYRGPIHGTIIDFIDGKIDIGAFVSPDMEETIRISQDILPPDNSRPSSLSTILSRPKPELPQMPPREEALQYIENYHKVIAPFVPILHLPTFRKQVGLRYLSFLLVFAEADASRPRTSMTILRVLQTNQQRLL